LLINLSYCTLLIGRIPKELCSIPLLSTLTFDDIAAVTCYPQCLTTVTELEPGTANRGCEADGICGFVAATNIAAILGHSVWQCLSSGIPTTDPCSASWPSVTCVNGEIVQLVLLSQGITGKVVCCSNCICI